MRLERATILSVTICCAILSALFNSYSFASENDSELQTLIAENRLVINLNQGIPSGPGGKWLRRDLMAYDYILLGESHGVADIANMATAIYRSVAPAGFDRAVIEVDPYVTPMLEKMLRSPDNKALKEHLKTNDNLLSIPFYSSREEADFLNAVINRSSLKQDVLIGVDQVFLAASEIVLKQLLSLSETETEKAAVIRALKATENMPFYVGIIPKENLMALSEAFKNSMSKAAIKLVEDIILTNEIYSPFTGRGGSILHANTLRENYMRENMVRHWQAIVVPGEAPPKLFFKFGGNHLMWGHSKTNVLSFGNLIAEYAIQNSQKATNLLVTCYGGEASHIQTGGTKPCESYMDLSESKLTTNLPEQGSLIINLKPLRYSKLFRKLDTNDQKLILAYDKLLLMRDVKAATLFEGTLPKF